MGNFIISGVYPGPELWSYGVYSGPELQSYGTEGKSYPLGRNFESYGARVWHSIQPGTLELRDIDFYFPCFFFFCPELQSYVTWTFTSRVFPTFQVSRVVVAVQ